MRSHEPLTCTRSTEIKRLCARCMKRPKVVSPGKFSAPNFFDYLLETHAARGGPSSTRVEAGELPADARFPSSSKIRARTCTSAHAHHMHGANSPHEDGRCVQPTRRGSGSRPGNDGSGPAGWR